VLHVAIAYVKNQLPLTNNRNEQQKQPWMHWKQPKTTTTTTRRCNAPASPFPVERPGTSAFGKFAFIFWVVFGFGVC